VAVFIISVVPLIGLIIVKFHRSPAYKYLLVTMLGLAVGTLTADAFLHLIPQVCHIYEKKNLFHVNLPSHIYIYLLRTISINAAVQLSKTSNVKLQFLNLKPAIR
jgi:ZIP Zinc transporter